MTTNREKVLVLVLALLAVVALAIAVGDLRAEPAPQTASHGGDHWPGCKTRACDKRVGDKVRERRKRAWLAKNRPWVWAFRYRLTSYDRYWARGTGSCESGNNPRTNTGNGYFGAFQFSASTARAAGFKVLPHYTSWHEQAVRAVRWRNRAGKGQWPVCGWR